MPEIIVPAAMQPKLEAPAVEDRFFIRPDLIRYVRFPADEIGTVIVICEGGLAVKMPLQKFENIGLAEYIKERGFYQII